MSQPENPPPPANGGDGKTYRQIFKSTAIVGGAQIIQILISIVRMKVLALLLGKTGVGLSSLYSSGVGLIGVVSGLGIGQSGVRQIAEAAGSGDEEKLARTVRTLRFTSLISGVIGALVVLVFCRQISQTTFNSTEYAGGFALLSVGLVFVGLAAGQLALLQGLRRLREMALAQIMGAVIGSIAAVVVVYFMGQRGVVWFLIAVTASSALASWWFARWINVPKPHMTRADFFRETRGLLGMGMAFMTAKLVADGTVYLTKVLILNHQLGLDSVALYHSASAMSSQYVGMILGAMVADFSPRLAAAANDNPQVNRLVNEQMELGVLLALPGVLATLAFAPWVLHLFYSGEFMDAAALLRWLVVGVFLRVVSWPLGMVLVAKGVSRLFISIEIAMGLLNIGLLLVCLKWWRLEGVGIAFAILYVAYTLVIWIICRRMSGYTISSRGLKIVLAGSLIVATGFLLTRVENPAWSLGTGVLLTLITSAGCYVGLRKLLQVDPWAAVMKKLGVRKAS